MQTLDLWPDGPPDPLADVGVEISFRQPSGPGPVTEWLRNVSRATLTVFAADPARANGAGVIIAPGGGWRVLAWEHEGLDMARWFAARGVTAFLLKYRVMGTPQDPEAFDDRNKLSQSREAELAKITGKTAPRAMSDLLSDDRYLAARAAAATDGRRALALVRDQADAFGIDPARVGLAGFSAGAFLAVDVTLNPDGPPPAFLAAIYGGETQGAPVPADAPPLFACVAQDDRMLFRVVEGLYADWSDADRPAEFHVFQKGRHGFGMVAQNRPVDRWAELLDAWLVDLKLI